MSSRRRSLPLGKLFRPLSAGKIIQAGRAEPIRHLLLTNDSFLREADAATGQHNEPLYLAHSIALALLRSHSGRAYAYDALVTIDTPEIQHTMSAALHRVAALKALKQKQIDLLDELSNSIVYHGPEALASLRHGDLEAIAETMPPSSKRDAAKRARLRRRRA